MDALLKRAEDAEFRLRRFLDSSIDLICTIDDQGFFSDISTNSIIVLGYEPEELVGRRYIDFVHPEDRNETRHRDESTRSDRPAGGFVNRYLHKDGRVVHLSWSTAWSSTDQMFYCVVRDITERVLLREQLSRAQRLEAVGNLTGGVAHDFNNLLTIILGSAETLVQKLQYDPSLMELAQLTQAAAERGAELTSRLLAFARRQSLEPKAVDPGALVKALEPLVTRTLGEDVELTIAVAPDCRNCLADPTQLESALLNLCINARHAMPTGGKLTIDIRNVSLDGGYARKNDVATGDYVLIAVCDSGEGMSAETMERCFEPFYTTKPAGSGSGLGLSMVYGFVKQSNGQVKIYSEPGLGTTVKIYMPQTSAGEASQTDKAVLCAPGGEEHILVVEDNELVRIHVCSQLTGLGYRVTAMPNGKAALKALSELEDVHLLFTDMVMPEMNGRELADQAILTHPRLKVLFTSGYTENTLVHRGSLDEGVQLLNKPYRKADLAHKVREALDGH